MKRMATFSSNHNSDGVPLTCRRHYTLELWDKNTRVAAAKRRRCTRSSSSHVYRRCTRARSREAQVSPRCRGRARPRSLVPRRQGDGSNLSPWEKREATILFFFFFILLCRSRLDIRSQQDRGIAETLLATCAVPAPVPCLRAWHKASFFSPVCACVRRANQREGDREED